MNSNTHFDEYINFQKYWLVLKRQWRPSLATLIGIVGTATFYSLSLPKLYEAKAELMIESDVASELTGIENNLGKVEALTYKSDPVTTQARILQSRPIIQKAITELDLQNDEGELLRYQDVLEKLKVTPVTGTDLLEVSYTSDSPEMAASIVNKVVELYIERDTLSNRSQSSSAREFIDKQLPKVEANLRQAEANLRDFKNENRIASLVEETTANINSTSNITQRLDEVKAELENVNARYQRLDSQLNISWQEASAISALSESLAVQRVLEQLQEVKVALAQKRNYLSDSAPQIISLREEEQDLTQLLNRQIENTLGEQQQNLVRNVNILSLGELKKAQIAEFASLGLQKEGLEQEIASLNNAYNLHKQQSDALPRLQEDQRELERRVEAAQSTYENLLKTLQNTQITEQQNIGNVSIISNAEIPEEAIGPRKKIIVAGAGIFGAFLSLAIAFWLDLRDKTIKNTLEIRQLIPYPLKGTIPELNKIVAKKQFLLPDSSMSNLPRLAATNLSSPHIREAYHNVQTNLKFHDPETLQKVIVVTSSTSGEGKSNIAANLAVALTQCGKNILLIDGDLRRGTQHNLWEVSNDLGFTNILERELMWQDSIHRVMSNLDLITSGTINGNPISLLNSPLIKDFLVDISSYYDSVIIDSPPLVGLADSKILGKLADGLLFVARPGVATYSSVSSATTELLNNPDLNVLGVIANGVNLNEEPYGYEAYVPDKKYLESAR